jgi:hypothetical protein
LTHAAEDGANTSTLLAFSGHTNVASLARYARVSAEVLARWQHQRTPTGDADQPRVSLTRALPLFCLSWLPPLQFDAGN